MQENFLNYDSLKTVCFCNMSGLLCDPNLWTHVLSVGAYLVLSWWYLADDLVLSQSSFFCRLFSNWIHFLPLESVVNLSLSTICSHAFWYWFSLYRWGALYVFTETYEWIPTSNKCDQWCKSVPIHAFKFTTWYSWRLSQLYNPLMWRILQISFH